MKLCKQMKLCACLLLFTVLAPIAGCKGGGSSDRSSMGDQQKQKPQQSRNGQQKSGTNPASGGYTNQPMTPASSTVPSSNAPDPSGRGAPPLTSQPVSNDGKGGTGSSAANSSGSGRQ